MDDYDQYDLRNATFGEFVGFLFDRDVVPIPMQGNGSPKPWYWRAEVAFDSTKVASFYIALFTTPDTVLEDYSPEQLNQGFWAIQSSNLQCAVTKVIWDQTLPFDIRESCVRSMFHWGPLQICGGIQLPTIGTAAFAQEAKEARMSRCKTWFSIRWAKSCGYLRKNVRWQRYTDWGTCITQRRAL